MFFSLRYKFDGDATTTITTDSGNVCDKSVIDKVSSKEASDDEEREQKQPICYYKAKHILISTGGYPTSDNTHLFQQHYQRCNNHEIPMRSLHLVRLSSWARDKFPWNWQK